MKSAPQRPSRQPPARTGAESGRRLGYHMNTGRPRSDGSRRTIMKDLGTLLARVLMAILFIAAGWGKLGTGYAGTLQYMAAMGVPPGV